ncbi:MAG: ATP-binding cassette domain-containing protein [Pyrinomonadaceae bacterium]|nr:ATP-binding cassette domain-containing protein [Pyrinomonadaceae bacterium]
MTKNENPNEVDQHIDMPPAPRIEFRDVSLAFDEGVMVLDHVSFKVAPGEMKVMLGESGGGKSTIIKLALGLEKPTAARSSLRVRRSQSLARKI